MTISDKPDMPEDWERDSQRNIAIDFDGVMHDPFDGPRNGECYGPPIQGAKEALAKISETYDIIIYTCKGRPNGPTYEGGATGTDLVWEWLREHDMDSYVEEVTALKPNARCYIDDKGIRFHKWGQALADMALLGIL